MLTGTNRGELAHWTRSSRRNLVFGWIRSGIRTMKQQMRFGSKAPRPRTHSRYGMKAMRLLGHRHLGSTSPVSRPSSPSLDRRPEHDTVRHEAGGRHAPKSNQQFAGQRDDHRRLARTFDTRGPCDVPSSEWTIPLEDEKPPRELDQTAPHSATRAGSDRAALGCCPIWRAPFPGAWHRSRRVRR
jgi:hypothetical protein